MIITSPRPSIQSLRRDRNVEGCMLFALSGHNLGSIEEIHSIFLNPSKQTLYSSLKDAAYKTLVVNKLSRLAT